MTLPSLSLIGFLLYNVILASNRRQEDPLDSCTQTDPASLDACVASAIDTFLSTYTSGDPTSSFDYSAVASSINSIASGLTSYGITETSFVPDPATFTGVGSTYSGPDVSDIVSSYSEYSATHSGTTGSVFSFDTSSFDATKQTSTVETSTSSSPSPTASSSSSSSPAITSPPESSTVHASTTMSSVTTSSTTTSTAAKNWQWSTSNAVSIGLLIIASICYL